MTILDRMYFIKFIQNYLIVLSCLLSLYVVIDLFTNINDFTNQKGSFHAIAKHILGYYGVQITLIFDKLCEFITIIAAVFTISGMQRGNELLPQLSAGVPTLRVIRPVILGALFSLCLAPINTELLIPQFENALAIPRDDPDLDKPMKVRGAYDSTTKEHFVGDDAYVLKRKVTKFEYTSSAESGSLVHMTAKEAVYIPEGTAKLSRGWQLYNAEPDNLPDPLPEGVIRVGPGQYFVRAREVDFDTIVRRPTWYHFAPTQRLWDLLDRPEGTRQSNVAVLFHVRLTRPLIGALMVLLALAVILRDQNRHVFVSAGICLVVTAIFYAARFGCKYLGEHDVLPPPLSAWLPVILASPVILGLFDGVHT